MIDPIRESLARIETDLSELRTEAARLSVKVDHLPSKGFIVSAVTVGVALLSALIVALGKIGLLAQAIK
jgi:hypothetical protein